MYPETDLKTVPLEKKTLAELKKNLPMMPNERKKMYVEKFKVSEQLAEKMKLSNEAPFFEALVEKGFDATQAATLLLEGLVQLRREGTDTERISERMVEDALLALKQKKIAKEALLELLASWSKKPVSAIGEIIGELGLAGVSEKEVEGAVKKIVEKNALLVKQKGLGAIGALMGDAMKELRGKASGELVSRILKEEILKAAGKREQQ
jgi:glutamyl-tRNA(Gln) amidotransferase subunit E